MLWSCCVLYHVRSWVPLRSLPQKNDDEARRLQLRQRHIRDINSGTIASAWQTWASTLILLSFNGEWGMILRHELCLLLCSTLDHRSARSLEMTNQCLPVFSSKVSLSNLILQRTHDNKMTCRGKYRPIFCGDGPPLSEGDQRVAFSYQIPHLLHDGKVDYCIPQNKL